MLVIVVVEYLRISLHTRQRSGRGNYSALWCGRISTKRRCEYSPSSGRRFGSCFDAVGDRAYYCQRRRPHTHRCCGTWRLSSRRYFHQTALLLAVRKASTTIMALVRSHDPKESIRSTDHIEINVRHFAECIVWSWKWLSIGGFLFTKELKSTTVTRGSKLFWWFTSSQLAKWSSYNQIVLVRRIMSSVSLAYGSTLLHIAAGRELIDISYMLFQYGVSLK